MPKSMDALVALAKRRGFVYPSSEIYGGFESTWDYGPLGAELVRNVKEAWWREIVTARSEVVGLNAAVLMSPSVWQASGHLENFSDPLVECLNCNSRLREDHLADGVCPNCGGPVSEARNFNTMFKTFVGPLEDDAAVAYLRPETAQAIFVNFRNVTSTSRLRLPFGIAQIGKAFRNEITTGNFIFRTREFEQMELEYFCHPGEDEKWFDYWVDRRRRWYHDLGIADADLRVRRHGDDELSHYSHGTSDLEFRFPFGWDELEGIARRSDFDLTAHQTASRTKLTVFDEARGEHVTPWVVEPSAGVDRCVLAFLSTAYREDEVPNTKGGTDSRTLLALDPRLAPYKAAVLPLIKREPLQELAARIHDQLRYQWAVYYDESGAIGRRYRRQDEIGTPYCITVDFESLEDDCVTLRDRDTLAQDRIPVTEVYAYLGDRLAWRPPS
ncbi:MAG: glycine--tRNA ligase [Chloroflexi bacterium]|nr:glycine--tRNA ligase [Chloroflexota bacterium]MDE2701594.1 glycine--tRNA ligase [Chloroflexota bacterium]